MTEHRTHPPRFMHLKWIIALVALWHVGSAAAADPRCWPSSLKAEPRGCHLGVFNWQQLQRRNIVMQRRDYSCGAAALATLVRYYWGDSATEAGYLKELDKLLTPEEVQDRIANGLSLTDLRRVAVQTGYQATLGKLSFAKLTESKVPVILAISVEGYDHFVVYRGWDGEWVYLADPIRGNVRVHADEFVKQWQKHAILAVAKPGEKIKEFSPLSVRRDEIALGASNRQPIRSRAIQLPPSSLVPSPVP